MTMPARQRRAIVIGGSMGGLLAANLLHRHGWEVAVYERVPSELSGRGAGIVTHAELFDALARAGVVVGPDIGVEVRSRVVLAPGSGTVVAERPLRQVLTAWSRLHRLLREALPEGRYHAGKALVAVEQDRQGVAVGFADGAHTEGDVLVAADGFRSTVRGFFLPEVQPVYAGYVAWRGLIDEAALSPGAHAALFEKFGFCLPPREQMLGYPVAGLEDGVAPGCRQYNFVWYRPAAAEDELPRLLTDDDGRCHLDGIPPHLVSTRIVREIRDTADRLLAPQFAEIVRVARQPFFQPIYDLETPRMAFGRVALLGDAAFVARPHCGMGVTKAGGDAVSLADALGDATVPASDALRRYETARLAFGRRIVAHARHLGAYMQAQLRTEQERAMAERYHTPEMVMRETAVAPPLAAAF